jgi:NCAIR mutase (PurE)-related protein
LKNNSIEALLAILGKGDISPLDALKLLNSHLTSDLGFARVDTGRGIAIVSRIDEDLSRILLEAFPEGLYSSRGRVFVMGEYRNNPDCDEGSVAVVSAGTSDLHAVEEASTILETMKVDTRLFCDIGVAGVHRLAEVLPSLRECSVCIVFAGMDAALPTVIGGLYRGPVVAVPTSTGYGTAFGGVTALLSMLNSCSPGICVLNIDNGLGAAAAALRILRGTD